MNGVAYFRLARAQTAAVEGAGFPLAAWIGGAPLWTLPLFALLGILCHFGGFGENGITDLALDRSDPSKADHPLVAGRIRITQAYAFVYGCQAAGIILFASLLWLSGAHAWDLPAALFAGYIMLGHAYNLVGKSWKPGAVLEISGAFALAFLASATAWTGVVSPVVLAVAAFAGVYTAQQIGVFGEEKELAQTGEHNILRRLGTTVGSPLGSGFSDMVEAARTSGGDVRINARAAALSEPWLLTSTAGMAFGQALAAAKALALFAVAVLVAGPTWGAAVGIVSWVMFATFTWRLLAPGPFDRPRRMRLMGLSEAIGYLLLVIALGPAFWPWLWVAFLALPVVWFAGFNRLLWSRTGSVWAPGV